jgi:hypothetical protein
MDDVSAVCGSKMVPFKKRETQTELTYNFCLFATQENASPTPKVFY